MTAIYEEVLRQVCAAYEIETFQEEQQAFPCSRFTLGEGYCST